MEVVVAVTILSVGIAGVMGVFSVCVRAETRAARLDAAVAIAREKLELTTATNIENLASDKGVVDSFSWSVGLAELQLGLMRASVEVRWTDMGRPRTFAMSQVFLPRQPEQGDGR